jgi:acetyl-CoA carboxylase, biotin carboxylase subunit
LDIAAIVEAALKAGADAVHPGYGFLSENAAFARAVLDAGLTWVGPPAAAIEAMGAKVEAKKLMAEAGVPVLSEVDDEFPLMIKASAGGGGRGMRIIRSNEELPNLFRAAQSEAAAAFGNGDLYLEKFLERPRHIEFQVLGDSYGKVISLGERECSIQRRHQKLLEESPSTQMTPELRERIGSMLGATLSKIGYVNAGTVEFLMDEDRSLYFIEMNTRIQVEHPVTEMVTDVDLVKSQILLAVGGRMDEVLQGKVLTRGHAIECRINAEHPEKFTPSAGKITAFHPPGGTGVRVDTAAYAEGVIPPYYDSLIAKLIVRGKDRPEAISRMARALEMFIVEGVYTTIPLHRRLLANADFRAGRFDTNFLGRFLNADRQEAITK